MNPVVTLIGAGAMGSGIGRRLVENGIEVRTPLEGRSAATRERALAAGLREAEGDALVTVDIILSVIPPDQALPVARHIASIARPDGVRPVFADCNAISPESAATVGQVIGQAGLPFVDGGIIGGPPREGYTPRLYLSGPHAAAVARLNHHGLDMPVLDGPVGAASALKMAYAGINKGIIAIAGAMILAAERAGAGPALYAELGLSQGELLHKLMRGIPDSYPKAYRWVPEMLEIAAFSQDPATEKVFKGFSAHFDRLASDEQGSRELIGILSAFLEQSAG